jgi:uncharacterized membrane protein
LVSLTKEQIIELEDLVTVVHRRDWRIEIR